MRDNSFKLVFTILFFFSSVLLVYPQAKLAKTKWDKNFFYIGNAYSPGEKSVGIVFKSSKKVKLGGLLRVVFESKKSIERLELFLVSPRRLENYSLSFLKKYFSSDGVSSSKLVSGKVKKNFLLHSYGFRVDKKLFPSVGINRELWIVLLGIPSFFTEGNYKIILKGQLSGEVFFYVSDLKVIRRPFKFEKLFLNSHLTALKESKNPLIFEQTKRLVGILKTFDEKKVFYVQKFKLPVRATRITSPFGERREYEYRDGKKERRIHNGIDYALPVGSPVRACADGEVVFSGERIITGKSVILEHMPGVYSIYYHLSKLVVRKGDRIKVGSIIGYSGMSGFATGPHLHWEIRVSGVAVNPRCFLEQNIIDKTLFIDNINKPTNNKIIFEGR